MLLPLFCCTANRAPVNPPCSTPACGLAWRRPKRRAGNDLKYATCAVTPTRAWLAPWRICFPMLPNRKQRSRRRQLKQKQTPTWIKSFALKPSPAGWKKKRPILSGPSSTSIRPSAPTSRPTRRARVYTIKKPTEASSSIKKPAPNCGRPG